MQKNSTDTRSKFADFGELLVRAARDYGLIFNDGTMDEEATANFILERIHELADELTAWDIHESGIRSLVDAVTSSKPKTRYENGRLVADESAMIALKQVLTIWGLLKDYRTELWYLFYTCCNYIK